VRRIAQVTAIVLLIVAASAGGALYFHRYGDRTATDYETIQRRTTELMKVSVPERLWPRLAIERPDVMTMVVYTTKDDQSCLAIARCLPSWTAKRGNRASQALESTLVQYFPAFETERWTGIEERAVNVGGKPHRVRTATARRGDDKHECRVVRMDDLPTDEGTLALYYQSNIDSLADAEIDELLKSLQ
jgi:hypothetical protein